MDTALEANSGPMVLSVVVTLVVLSTVFASARFYTRACIRKQFYLDDVFLVVAIVLQWIGVSFFIPSIHQGIGRHSAALTDQQRESLRKWYAVGVVPAVIALGVPKLAIAVLLNRILLPGPKAKAASWFLAVTCTLAFVAVIALNTLQCIPVQAQWESSITDKKCLDSSVVIYSSIGVSAFSAFVDLYFAIWPAVVFLTMQMNRGKRIGLSVAMGLGTVAAGVAVLKCSILWAVGSSDFSWDNSGTEMFTVAEGTTIIMAASVPMLAPLYHAIAHGCGRLKSRICGSAQQVQNPSGWDFGPRERMRPRDDAELGRSSLAKGQSWESRRLCSILIDREVYAPVGAALSDAATQARQPTELDKVERPVGVATPEPPVATPASQPTDG